MDDKTATQHDAELILTLYDLRREEVLRKARQWVTFEFNPKNAEEFFAVTQGIGTQENAYFRQVVSYWEMAGSMVLRGAINADLFFDSNGEGIYLFAKFQSFHDAYHAKTGRPFMRHTAQLIEKYPAARDIYGWMLKSIQARAI